MKFNLGRAHVSRVLSSACLFGVGAAALSPASCSVDATVSSTKPSVPYESGSPWPKFRRNAVQDGASTIHATPTDGALWSYRTAKGIFSSPVIAADGTIYIGSADRYFYALNADGTLKWKKQTGEIIDSSALLDNQGRVYFGSGDGKLRALDAKTGNDVWAMTADDPSVNTAFINWFEGNVAMAADGTLYVPNDNFFVYAIDRATGNVSQRLKMPDQTWSLPAIDTATGSVFIGNNNLLPILGRNTFSFDSKGNELWTARTLGSIAASPLLTPDGKMIVGGFDGYVRAYDSIRGEQLWETGTREHVYASPARLPTGLIVQPSADGTIYALNPADGTVRWAFDTREPIRSSPAVDADGNVYVGSGEGRLFVLKPDGTLRWSMKLIDEERNDLNASPALGTNAIYIAGESGDIFSIPYDYCLRAPGLADRRCTSTGGEDLPPDGAFLFYTTPLGAMLAESPAAIDENQALTFSLQVRAAGDTHLALLDSASLKVTTDPPSDVAVEVAGDGKFVTVTPKTVFAKGADGGVQLSVTGNYLEGFDRNGLRLRGGTVAGVVSSSHAFHVNEPAAAPYAMTAPAIGAPAPVWEIARLAMPLPVVMPSYNQIGFDSLHYALGVVEMSEGHGVAWMAGAHLVGEDNVAVVDPATKALFPLEADYRNGYLTLRNEDGLQVEIMNATIPFRAFRIGAPIGNDGSALRTATLSGSTVCATVPFYGQFLQVLGLCNPQTDILSVFGGAIFRKRATDAQIAETDAGAVVLTRTATGTTATITGSTLKLAQHVFGLLLVDTATGKPVTLDYGLATTRTATPTGEIASVTVPFGERVVPASVRAYLMVDTVAAATGALTP